MQSELFIGLMSGTSLDGIDAALVSFDAADHSVQLHKTCEFEFPQDIHTKLRHAVETPDETDSQQLKELDDELGLLYASSVNSLLKAANIPANDVTAIGCHGQTVDHQPDANPPFSLQLGSGEIIAKTTGITTVNDFRRADIKAGGQGAPLAPGFHEWAFGQQESTSAIVNIGGIANITILSPDEPVKGYDTGPGNTLLDLWCHEHTQKPFDNNGAWGNRGKCDSAFLKQLLQEPYLSRTPPKSTGRELFNLQWLKKMFGECNLKLAPQDVQATLTEFTAQTIATAAQQCAAKQILICGGGARNAFLMGRLAANLQNCSVITTDRAGVPADWVEAIAFAWFARARLAGIPAGIPSVTGARSAELLGTIHLSST